jgi:hypothetical protein
LRQLLDCASPLALFRLHSALHNPPLIGTKSSAQYLSGHSTRSVMRPVIDYSKDLRRKLADGKSFDVALGELSAAGASIFDCIASVRSFQRCDLAEAKRTVESSVAWPDVHAATDQLYQDLIDDKIDA